MDPVSQGLLGCTLAQTQAKPNELRKAALIGLIAGLAADLDFFIRSSSDPLLNIEYHRHFTHSLFFAPLAAVMISLLLWPLFKQSLSWHKVFLFSLMGYLLSGFLDACTSYGTRLLWPFIPERISFNIISIIDPIFTLILFIGVLIALLSRKRIFSISALILATLYLSLGWLQHERAIEYTRQLASENHHSVERVLAKPTLGNLLLWRSIYQYDDRFHINALWIHPITGQIHVHPGTSIQRLDIEKNFKLDPNSIANRDILRFADFSDHFLAQDPQQSNRIIDVRYSMLPHRIEPIWSIVIDPQQPERHATFEVTRDRSVETRSTFINMLLNR